MSERGGDLKLHLLADAVREHVHRDPPREEILGPGTELAIVDSLLVGVAAAVIDHGGETVPELWETWADAHLALEWSLENEPTLMADPYVASLLRAATLLEQWLIHDRAE